MSGGGGNTTSDDEAQREVKYDDPLTEEEKQHPVYCSGSILHIVQMSELFEDCKSFVDLQQKYPIGETLLRFDEFQKETGGNATKEQIALFINKTFFENGNELVEWKPTDWVENPKFISEIEDEDLRKFATDLNSLWPKLGRMIKDDILFNDDQYSLIYVPNGFIVPGGRFQEYYYWDTYWIIRSLLLCEMATTVKGMLENLLLLVEQYGLVPNGGRVYYLHRSQPPLLIPMIFDYINVTKDMEFLKKNFHTLEKEYRFWVINRTVTVMKNGKVYKMAHYNSGCTGPRAESYRHDYINAQAFSTPEEQQKFYVNIKAAAESGWDFSSRWFIKDGTNKGNLTNISTTSIIPVDLNSFLYQNAVILQEMSRLLEDKQKMLFYYTESKRWKDAVQNVLWNEETGIWEDYDMKNNKNRNYFYASNLTPLWTGCYEKNNKSSISAKVISYIKSSGILEYSGGIPSSLEETGEQWDFPNAWPPLQDIVIQGLSNLEEPEADDLAQLLATNWIRANYLGYSSTGNMYEKYDARFPGKRGTGGEYVVQTGFGWTNGVVLNLLYKYRKDITLTDQPKE